MSRARCATVFLPSMENDSHRLCVTCLGKSYRSDDHCEECYNWSDDHCNRVSEYLAKLSLQREKRRERKAEASSSSFSGFSPSMPVPLCRLLSSAGTGVVMTILSSSVCGHLLGRCSCGVHHSVCSSRGRDSCGAKSRAVSCGFFVGEGEDACHFLGAVGFSPVFVAALGFIVCSSASACDSSC